MRNFGILLIVTLWATAQGAFALTPSECIEIKEKYGVDAPDCASVLLSSETTVRTDRLSAANAIPVTRQQRQDNVFFFSGGARLPRDEIAHLERLAVVLNTELMRDTCLQLVGHSDSVGSEKANLALALRRSQAVAEWLGDAIGESRIISVISQGEWKPLDNLTPDHKYQRRVEVHARRCQ